MFVCVPLPVCQTTRTAIANSNHLFIAVEYFYGRRVNFDAQFGQDHRLNLVFRYMMNR